MKSFINNLTAKQVAIFLVLVCVAICIQCYVASKPNQYTRYNNYVIFKQSFAHLLHNQNLYDGYPKEHYDLYKYSPTFALLMGVFYYLPDFVGLLLFNFLNIAVFMLSVFQLKLPEKKSKWLLLFMLVEVGISLTSTQTNLLIAGLIVLSFAFLERGRFFWAALFIALTVYIKIFGIVAFALWFLYPDKIKFALYSIFWMVILALLPMIIISPAELTQQYVNWRELLKNDHSLSYGASFLGWMHSWFKIDLPKVGTVIVAAVVFCIPLLKVKQYKHYFFRLQMLASVLIWIVIFNHKGESPTYSIALYGVALWFFSQQPTPVHRALLWLCLVFTSFSSTDLITPHWVMNNVVEPYAVKAVFCCIVWGVLIYELLTESYKPDREVEGTANQEA